MLLPPTERRRAPDTVVIAVEAAARACEAAARDPATMPSVFASTQGDLTISDYLCETLATAPAMVSPTKFHNSVHNAGAGYWTIATGALAPYTAVTAYEHTFGAGLLEALAQVESRRSSVLYVAYDIEARGPMAALAVSVGLLGTGLVLASEPSERAVAAIDWKITTRSGARTTRARAQNAALVQGNALQGCLVVFEALADAVPRTIAQTLGDDLILELTLDFAIAGRQGAPR
jgi:hypothetical protein